MDATMMAQAAAYHLARLAAKVSDDRAASLLSRNVITGCATCRTRPDGARVVALGHLTGDDLAQRRRAHRAAPPTDGS